jgi:hypothetical protein
MSFVYNNADIDYKTQVFYSSGNWIKPMGITMVSITAIGAGGGGGGGTTAAVTAARSGGGSGGSGAITILIIPEMFITDSLDIKIGIGGNGGVSSGGAGTNGGNTYVDMVTKGNGGLATVPGGVGYTSLIVASGGTASPGTSNGTGGPIAVISDALYSSMGIWFAGSGAAGVVAGASVTYGSTGIPLVGGAGGGGMAANITAASDGGTITGQAEFIPSNIGGLAGARGNNGIFNLKPFFSLGGSGGGGGGTTPNSGGNGGNGAPGCGGGGGGGGTTPTGVGGTGGRGGDGLVIINCW